MESAIESYVAILTNNTLVCKHFKITDGKDKAFDPMSDTNEIDESKEAIEYSAQRFVESIQNEWLQPDYLKSFELNGYRKRNDLMEFLDSKFEEFKDAFAKNKYWNDKNLIKELSLQLWVSQQELHELDSNSYRYLKDKALHWLFKTKFAYCVEAHGFVRNFAMVISDPVEKRPARIRRPLENLTSLTQNQIVILFHNLREFGYVGKKMPNNIYAEPIAKLTGLSNEKIRQYLSHIKPQSDSVESREFQDTDYDAVRRVLKRILSAIEPKTSR